jgi:hypothetical protein
MAGMMNASDPRRGERDGPMLLHGHQEMAEARQAILGEHAA